ncbi:hypothetical protein D3C72_2016290 [compost metagenome]
MLRPACPECQAAGGQGIDGLFHYRGFAYSAEQHDGCQAKAHQRQSMAAQWRAMEADIFPFFDNLAQTVIGVGRDVAFQTRDQHR